MLLNPGTLANGFTVVHYPVAASSYAIGIRIEAGSRLDPPAYRGLAHVLEHVLLHLPGDDGRELLYGTSDGRIRTQGGWTSREETVYTMEVAVDALPQAVGWICRALFQPVFTPAVLETQLRVIANEAERHRAFRPTVPLEKRTDFDSAFFGEANLADAIIGHESTRDKITLEALANWHARRYVGQRATVVIVGPGETATIEAQAAAVFEAVPAGKAVASPDPAPDGHGIGKRIRRSGAASGTKTYYSVGFRTGGTSDPDWPVFGVLCALAASRLDRTLKNDLGLTYALGVSREGGPDWGRFAIHADALPTEGPKLIQELDRQISAWHETGFGPNECDAVVARLRQKTAALGSPIQILQEIIWQVDGWKIHPAGPVEWNTDVLDSQEINRAARRLFDPRRRVVVVSEGQGGRREQTRILALFAVASVVLVWRTELYWLSVTGWNLLSRLWSQVFG